MAGEGKDIVSAIEAQTRLLKNVNDNLGRIAKVLETQNNNHVEIHLTSKDTVTKVD